MLRIRLFGGLAVEHDGRPVAAIAEQHKALALLALVAASGERGVNRDRLAAYLWPESDADRARGALSQTLYTLRKQLDAPEIFAGTRTLRLRATVIGSDLRDFEEALARGDAETAMAHYAGPFLDGFFASASVEFERWVDEQRADFARRAGDAMDALAHAASDRGDHAGAVAWWRRRAATEPGNSRVVAGLVSALARAGDRAGALQVARAHEEFLHAEFDAPPDPLVAALADEIRHAKAESVRPHASATPQDADNSPLAPAFEDEGSAADVQATSDSATSVSRVVALAGLVIAATVTIATMSTRERRHPSVPTLSERRISVAGFENETGDSSLARIGRLATDWVVQGLLQTQLVEVTTSAVRAAGLPALGDSAPPRAAGLVVRGSYTRVADTLVVQALVVEVATGRVVRAVAPVSGPLAEPLVAIEQVRQRITGELATKVDRRLARWADAASQPTSFEAYRAFDRGLDEFFSLHDSSDAVAGRMLVHAAALDTTFNLPLLWALYAFDNANDYVRFDSVLRVLEARRERLPRFDRALLDARAAARRGDANGEYEALRRVVAIAPKSEWVFKLANAAFYIHRVAEADSLLESIDPDAGWLREWQAYWSLRADASYYMGRHDDELFAARTGQRRFPANPPGFRRQEGRAFASLGREREALALVDDALVGPPRGFDSEMLFRILCAARLHGQLHLARAIAKRALENPVTGVDMGDSSVTRARFELLVLHAAELWDDAAASARRLIRVNAVAHRHDAFPYLVLLEAALHRGAVAPRDTAGLEARAFAEAGAMTKADDPTWQPESKLVLKAELAAMHGDARTTAGLVKEFVESGAFEYGIAERAIFDPVRGDSAVAQWLHDPKADRTTLRTNR